MKFSCVKCGADIIVRPGKLSMATNYRSPIYCPKCREEFTISARTVYKLETIEK